MTEPFSESEQMYLVTIAQIQETEAGPVSITHLANELAILPVSVNQMIRKLADTGVVIYTPYKGVSLTASGAEIALRILRHRRLWEVFLVKRLGYSPLEADNIACRLEHILPASAADRLADHLGNPQLSPKGRTIPEADATSSPTRCFPLIKLRVNESAQVIDVKVDTPARSFLIEHDLSPGHSVTLLASSDNDDLLLETDSGKTVCLSKRLADSVIVTYSG
jgi:DtxR family transcriptional regulator, Mn-dependent transcriptional regulator